MLQKEEKIKGEKNGKPRSTQQLWDYFKKELKKGEGGSMDFQTIPRVDVPGVLELQQRGFISVCRLKIKIVEKYREEKL